jgi:hypothetical protein
MFVLVFGPNFVAMLVLDMHGQDLCSGKALAAELADVELVFGDKHVACCIIRHSAIKAASPAGL